MSAWSCWRPAVTQHKSGRHSYAPSAGGRLGPLAASNAHGAVWKLLRPNTPSHPNHGHSRLRVKLPPQLQPARAQSSGAHLSSQQQQVQRVRLQRPNRHQLTLEHPVIKIAQGNVQATAAKLKARADRLPEPLKKTAPLSPNCSRLLLILKVEARPAPPRTPCASTLTAAAPYARVALQLQRRRACRPPTPKGRAPRCAGRLGQHRR